MAAVSQAMQQTPRASSLENLNSRLRNFFLRRQLGPQYLDLLQFFLNHRTFMRSECPERVGKRVPLMTGQPHAHWLELLFRAVSTRLIPAPKIHLSLVASADKPSSFTISAACKFKIGCF